MPTTGRATQAGIILAGLILVACGGGGGGDVRIAPTPTPLPSQPTLPTPLPTAKPSATPTPAPTSAPTTAPTLAGSPAPQPTPTPAPGTGNQTFRVEGFISLNPGTRVDGDLNNPEVALVPNNTAAQAQTLPGGSRIGGYVNSAGAGAAGQTRAAGDDFDAYRLRLSAGQAVNLYIAEPDGLSGDLDLELYTVDSPPVLIAGSYGGGSTAVESVEVPTDGEYFVVVIAYEDAANGVASASNYVLEASTTFAAQHLAHTGLEFVADEALVDLDTANYKQSAVPLDQLVAEWGMTHQRGVPGQTLRLQRSAGQRKALPPRFGQLDARQTIQLRTLLGHKIMQRDARVRVVEPNLWRRLQATPNDPFYAEQWHYPLINLPQAWDLTTGRADVLVAVVDTGVLTAHPDLQANLDPNDPSGVDFIADPASANDGTGPDQDANDAGDAENPDGSSSFHGTHVAGTVAAVADNDVGVAGVCWRCKIMPLRALGVGGGSLFDITQSVRYAAGLANAYGIAPAQRADIINLSLGGGGFSQLEQDTYTEVRDAGVIVVAAAGNAGTTERAFPASYTGVLSVAAVGPDRRRAPYSQFNADVDLAAPGGDGRLGRSSLVVSTLGFGTPGVTNVRLGYGMLQGTSMAAPHVAGVIALMKSLHPQLTPAELEAALAAGRLTDDAGAAGFDNEYGFGVINALKATQEAQRLASGQVVAVPPRLQVSPNNLDLGAVDTEATVILRNAGGGELSVTGVRADTPDWLTVRLGSANEAEISVRRDLLTPGTYAATVSFESSANTAELNVRLEVMDPQAVGVDDASRHYVLLIPLADPDAAREVAADVRDGGYRFAFADVPGGDYVLVAGSDMDNDLILCDPGEACAMYPVNGDPQPLRVDRDQLNLRFSSGFSLALPESGFSVSTKREAGGWSRPSQSHAGLGRD